MSADAVIAHGREASASPASEGTRPTWRLSPAVLLLAAAAALAAPLRLGVTPYAVMVGGALAVLVVLSAIDLQARILPNKILLPAMAAVLAGQLVFYPGNALESVVAAFGAVGLLLTPRLFNPAAMGMGDVKLAAFLGLLLGAEVLPALMLGFLATAPVLAMLLVTRGRAARRASIPLGPFLALGAAIVLLV
jgi:leader peptidase (prepilin peptidase)/N-methyltransferase